MLKYTLISVLLTNLYSSQENYPIKLYVILLYFLLDLHSNLFETPGKCAA